MVTITKKLLSETADFHRIPPNSKRLALRLYTYEAGLQPPYDPFRKPLWASYLLRDPLRSASQ